MSMETSSGGMHARQGSSPHTHWNTHRKQLEHPLHRRFDVGTKRNTMRTHAHKHKFTLTARRCSLRKIFQRVYARARAETKYERALQAHDVIGENCLRRLKGPFVEGKRYSRDLNHQRNVLLPPRIYVWKKSCRIQARTRDDATYGTPIHRCHGVI